MALLRLLQQPSRCLGPVSRLITQRSVRQARKPQATIAQKLKHARQSLTRHSGVDSRWLVAPDHHLSWQRLILRPLAFSFAVAGGSLVAGSFINVYLQKYHPTLRRDWQRKTRNAIYRVLPPSIGQYAVAWLAQPAHTQFAHMVVALNVLVFGLWKVPALTSMMHFHFLHAPMSGRLSGMIGSFVSHKQFWHLAFNSIAFVSFVPTVYYSLGGMAPTAGFCMASGVMASSASLLFSMATRSITPGLGLSGVVFALFGFTTCLVPDTKLNIIFFPFFTFTAEQALVAVLLFDTVGMIFRFSSLGHAAHMGGTLFGYFFAQHHASIMKQLNKFSYQVLN
eukprot:m.29660 g.29660  ORF g.29660 m.29660 type:complete len:337 (-) comp11964_c0_seq1:48-1058(-)